MTRLLLLAAVLASLVLPVNASAALEATERREINALLDRFVVEAVERRDPEAAYELATPALRGGTSRADWRRGELPVMPYQALGRTFHQWLVAYDDGNDVGVDLILRPAKTNRKHGSILFHVDLRRVASEWRVDSFVPAATFSREGEPPRIWAHADGAPQDNGVSVSRRAKPRVGSGAALLPLALLGAAIVPLLGFGIFTIVRNRRAERRFELGS